MGSCCSNVLRAILFIDCIFIVLRLLHNLCFQSFDLLSLISGLGPLSYILSSIVLIFISLLGAYGVIVESSRHLKQFALVFSIYTIVVALLSVTVFVTFDADGFNRTMENHARDYQWDRKPGEEPNKATRIWDSLQRDLHCCGLNGPWDWREWSHQSVLPDSCCPKLPGRLVSNIYDRGGCSADKAFGDGCTKQRKEVASVALVLTLLSLGESLFLVLIALNLARRVKSDHVEASSSEPQIDLNYPVDRQIKSPSYGM